MLGHGAQPVHRLRAEALAQTLEQHTHELLEGFSLEQIRFSLRKRLEHRAAKLQRYGGNRQATALQPIADESEQSLALVSGLEQSEALDRRRQMQMLERDRESIDLRLPLAQLRGELVEQLLDDFHEQRAVGAFFVELDSRAPGAGSPVFGA